MGKKALVIGATGLLGHGITNKLAESGWNTRAIGIEALISSNVFSEGVDYRCGDFYDEAFLLKALEDIDKVYFFLSSTFPSTSTDSLELEISRTLKGLDYLLRKMRDMGVKEIVYPSSGGTIYGNVPFGKAKETDQLHPMTPYGVGKKMCEEMLEFYSAFGISSTILRVGNVYGTPLARKTAQGVIDVFVQKAIQGEAVTIWGDANTSIRDYIFVDDFSDAVVKIGEMRPSGIEKYNLSSGVGVTLEEIISAINKYSAKPLKVNHIQKDVTSSIKRIVLDMNKFVSVTNWHPRYDIDTGIAETFERKKHLLEI